MPEKNGLGCGSWFLIAVSIMVVLGFIVQEFAPSTPDEYDAKKICENAVGSRLKAPSTAKYDSRVQINADDENDYRILTSVDSQNGFGAMVRTDFACNLTWSTSRESWTLEKVRQN